MRVTNSILQRNFISNLNFSSERLYESENRVLTNKRVNRPSDDPVDALTSLEIRSRISEIGQYQRNIGRSKTILENSESLVTQTAEIFQKLKTLTIQGASDSYGPLDKLSIAGEVNQLAEQIFNLANSRSESIYIFAGTNNDVAPYQEERDGEGEVTKVTTNGSAGNITCLIGERIKIKININGEDLFEKGENLFDLAIKVRDDLRVNDIESLREDLNSIDEAAEKIYNTQAILGSKLNRIEAASTRADGDIISFSEFLSNAEDVDSAEAIMDYQRDLLTLQATLQAGARIMQPTLADFLR